MIGESQKRTATQLSCSSRNNNSSTRHTHQPGRTSEPKQTMMENESIIDTTMTREDSSLCSPLQPTSIQHTTTTTTTSSNESATDVWRWLCSSSESTIGSETISTNGSADLSQQTWSGMPNTQTYLGTNLYPSYPSSTPITLPTEHVTSTPYIPYTTNEEEESLRDGAIWNYRKSGEETSTPTCYLSEGDVQHGVSPGGLWVYPLSLLSDRTPKPETILTPIDTYLRCHRVNHEQGSEEEAEIAALTASWEYLVHDMTIPTEEELDARWDAIREDGDGETESLMQDAQDDKCDGQTTYEHQSSPSMSPYHTHPPDLSLAIAAMTVRDENEDAVEEEESEDEGVEWTSNAWKERTGRGLTFCVEGRQIRMTYQEGFEQAKRSLQRQFDLNEAYALGRLIKNNKQTASLAKLHLGTYYARIAIAVYKLYRGHKGEWDNTLTLRDYYYMNASQINHRRQQLNW